MLADFLIKTLVKFLQKKAQYDEKVTSTLVLVFNFMYKRLIFEKLLKELIF